MALIVSNPEARCTAVQAIAERARMACWLPMQHQVIHIRSEAPRKPVPGAPCNGCGVCCLAEPCPVGVIVSRRRHGACAALVWSTDEGCYRCGLLVRVADEVGTPAPWWRRWARSAWARWARRMISAGSGCDAELAVELMPDPAGDEPGGAIQGNK